VSGDIDVQTALRAGEVPFMGLAIATRPGVLVARPETELLGNEAVTALRSAGSRPRVIDVCCGSGNLACGIASKVPDAEVWAVDLTLECADLARHNVQRLGLPVRVMQGDLLGPLEGQGLAGTVDVIVCNPPYISSGKLEKDKAELLTMEPREAFDGGPYGLTIHGRIINEALPFLKPGGFLMVELGARQEKQVKMLFDRAKAYGEARLVNDAGGVPRVAVAQKS
jgi:release factor glutamine methyltransferase